MSVVPCSACCCRNDASPVGRGEELLCGRLPGGPARALRGTRCARAAAARPRGRWSGAASARDGACSFSSARAAVGYDGPAPAGSWPHGRSAASRASRAVAADLVAETVPPPPVEVLTFVPGEGDRVGWRGANPAEELSQALGVRWGLPVQPGCWREPPRPAPARALPGRAPCQRPAAFRAAGASPPAVGLVDDVYTTRATVGAAARELRRAGARTVSMSSRLPGSSAVDNHRGRIDPVFEGG